MYLEIYIDTLFFINFIMDMILLFTTAIIMKRKIRFLRITAGGLAGAVIGCIPVVFIHMSFFLKWIIMYPISSVIMILISFGYRNLKSSLNAISILFITTFLFAGILNMLYANTFLGYYMKEFLTGRNTIYTMESLLIFSVAAMLIIFIGIRVLRYLKTEEEEFYEVELILGKKMVKVTALYDTGNGLSDPVTGNAVIIAEYDYIKDTLDNDWREYIEAFSKGSNYEFRQGKYNLKMRLIPYNSIGKENGLLLGIVFDRVKIYKKGGNHIEINNTKNTIVAIHMGKISSNNKYHLILHKDLLKT